MKLVILCEGHTEEDTLRAFLIPYTQGFTSVQVKSGGGASKLAKSYQIDAENYLQEDDEAIVFCLIDIHEAPFKYPKRVYDDVEPYHAMYLYIKQYMQAQIAESYRHRFYAFPVIMELETWILADIQVVNDYLKLAHNDRIQPYHAPESVLHPAKELRDLFWKHRKQEYRKRRHGKQLFQRLSAQTVYDDNCPHFELLINQLLEVQGISPPKSNARSGKIDAEIFATMQELERQKEVLKDDMRRLQEGFQNKKNATESDLNEVIAQENKLTRAIEAIETQLESITQQILKSWN